MRRLLLTAACVLLAACPAAPGADGPQGPKGDPGEPGSVGAQGAVGAQGPQGTPGVAGPVGATGAVGPQGPMGTVLVLDGGVVTGPRGPQGASLVVLSLDAGVQCPTGGVLVALEDGGSPHAVCNGVQGPSGPMGPTGPTGLPGVQGMMGPMGPVGPAGPMGATGPTGLPGVQGMIGLTGPAGPVGPMGATGPTGLPGAQGTIGLTGPVGPAGATGPAGAQGPAGPIGMTGAAGPAGMTGSTGSAGATGPMGPPGPAGPALLLDGGVLPVSTSDGFSFSGFTTAIFTGNLGGPIGANAKCAAEFTGSHLCTEREFEWVGSSTLPGANGFWADDSQYSSSSAPNYFPRDRSGSYSCDNWRSQDGAAFYAQFSDFQGVRTSPAVGVCNVARRLSCCRSPHAAWFRGFTAAVFTGNLGGPLGANARCAAEYPNSHLCTEREFEWAGVAVSPGAAGFWADDSQYSSSSAPNYYPRDRSGSYSCDNWRSEDGPAFYAQFSDAQGIRTSPAVGVCNVARQLSCCGG